MSGYRMWGGGVTRNLIESIGYKWIGGDIFFDNRFAVIFDAHHLPFKGKCFDLVLCIAVFEHLENPWRAIDEIRRCTKKKGILFSTVAFLQPFHGNSYYHMTFLGVRSLFEKNGFHVTYLKPGGNVLQYAFKSLLPVPFLPKVLEKLANLFMWFYGLVFSYLWNKKHTVKISPEDIRLKYANSYFCVGERM